MRVHGIIVPLVTPFKRDLSIDYDALAWLLSRLGEAGVQGVFSSSSTGEFVHLDMDEVRELNSYVAGHAGRIRVYAGVTANSTEQAVGLARAARDAGADGVVAAPPYYYKPSSEDMYRYFSAIAERGDMPLLLYNNAGITGRSIPIEVILHLLEEHSNVVGVKVTYDSFSYLSRLIDEAKARRKDFSVLTGSAYLSLPCLMTGGDGVVPALANAYPRTMTGLYEAWRDGRLREASEIYSRILELSRLYVLPGHLGANLKKLLHLAGAPMEPVSRPPASTAGNDLIKAFLERHPPEVLQG